MTNSTARLLSPSLLSWLRCFDATARHVSFTRAAEDLCVTQGAVSQQVKQLEQWLGRRLLLRSPRALALTPEGQRLARVLRESLQAIESTLVDLRQVNDAQPVTMSCAPSFAMAWLTPRLGSFFQKHPQIGLRVQAEFHALDRSRMLNDGVDAALRFDLGHYPDLHAHELLSEWLVPVASPAFVAAHPALATPEGLTGAMLLHDFSPWEGAAAHQEWAHWFAQMALAPPDWALGHTYNLAMLAQCHIPDDHMGVYGKDQGERRTILSWLASAFCSSTLTVAVGGCTKSRSASRSAPDPAHCGSDAS